MLGELLGEFQGKTTGLRVLPSEGPFPRFEGSSQESGNILGEEVIDYSTYRAVARPGGIIYGEGDGVMMAKGGDMLTYKVSGIGRFLEKGGATWRGSIFFQTLSEKLGRLNGIVGVFEYDEDENGNTKAKVWEWK